MELKCFVSQRMRVRLLICAAIPYTTVFFVEIWKTQSTQCTIVSHIPTKFFDNNKIINKNSTFKCT